MKIYVVIDRKGILNPRLEYHGIFLTEEDARVHAMYFDNCSVYIYDLDKPLQLDTGALIANDGLRIPERF